MLHLGDSQIQTILLPNNTNDDHHDRFNVSSKTAYRDATRPIDETAYQHLMFRWSTITFVVSPRLEVFDREGEFDLKAAVVKSVV